jgi:galactofuranosylgalactofuranosylrhamnosyl-N-acetylglucosaminyl-diphospho-decaprenol beta-1,5/1,6-galactofuranosyltransferase
MTSAPDRPDETRLQALVFPEAELAAHPALYARLSGGARFTPDGLSLDTGAIAGFDTYFNAFDAGEWRAATTVDALGFRLEGEGPVTVRLLLSFPDGREKELAAQEATLAPGKPQRISLGPVGSGIIHAEITARGAARIIGGGFTTPDAPPAWPRLTIAITTFRREQAVAATARRLDAFLRAYAHANSIEVLIVDNGGTAEIAPTAHIRRVVNANLGGAGGFARGLIEARACGASHCLFMDDDAMFHMENLARTHAFLAFARDPATALAGAMITNTHPHQVWENGAVFDGICHPLHNRTDLADRAALYAMLFAAADPLPVNGYGGWWYFAFPVDHARHDPFPFFVRGDDSGFSLANPFSIRTLNGVVSFQDAFGEKETPLIHYLDLRYHLVHHLVFESLDRGPLGTAWVALQLILRSVAKFHYASAEAQLIALDDVLSGPDFFLANADMSARRAEIAALSGPETFRPIDAAPVPAQRRGLVRELAWALTLNGHLVPLHAWFGDDRVLPLAQRGPIWPIFGARSLTYVDPENSTGYTMRQSKRRGLALAGRGLARSITLMRRSRALKALYRGRYDDITREATWRKLLGLPGRQD